MCVTPSPERSDEELMVLLQRNVAEALGDLYDRHHRLVLALAYRILGDRATAEEVVQETFLSVWQQARTYRYERGGARTWLLSIARHRAIDRLRRAPKPGQVAELDDTLIDWRLPEVWEQVDAKVRQRRVRQVLETLPPEQREVVELAYYGGLSQQQIAERMTTPLGTVKGRTRLAMEKLRLALADLMPEAGGTA
jgi:RNA polymerase sigma-70 factor (ECF subfamily)